MSALSASAAPRPLLLDTDIGTDIDDVYALILAAASPEFDLRAVTVVNDDVMLRARMARQALNLLGRQEVPVSVGAAVALTPGERRGWAGHEGLGLPLPDASETAAVSAGITAAPDAARRIADCAVAAHAAGTPLTVCPIGAMTNLALALRCYPEETRLIGQVIAMASDFGGFGLENARGEHNIACDPVAAEIVLRSGLPVTLIGLNVTGQTRMTLADVEALEAIGGPLADALAGMHRVWFAVIRRDHSPMHDGLTLALQLDPAILTLKEAVAQVTTRGPQAGYTRYDAPGGLRTVCRVATAVDAPRYHELLQSRVREAARQAKNRAANEQKERDDADRR
jgi:purine nucleosidase